MVAHHGLHSLGARFKHPLRDRRVRVESDPEPLLGHGLLARGGIRLGKRRLDDLHECRQRIILVEQQRLDQWVLGTYRPAEPPVGFDLPNGLGADVREPCADPLRQGLLVLLSCVVE